VNHVQHLVSFNFKILHYFIKKILNQPHDFTCNKKEKQASGRMVALPIGLPRYYQTAVQIGIRNIYEWYHLIFSTSWSLVRHIGLLWSQIMIKYYHFYMLSKYEIRTFYFVFTHFKNYVIVTCYSY